MEPSSPSEIIDRHIAKLTDWRGETFAAVRKVMRDADPDMVEELKWLGTPTWSHNGIVAVAAAFKDKVKLTFYEGALLPDHDKLFNSGLEGKRWHAIDFYEKDKVNEKALKKLVLAAVAYNITKASAPKKAVKTRKK